MPLIIDCYNVLHTDMPAVLAGLDEAGLCRALARSPWRADRITVVCDGRPKPLGLTESPVAEVSLVYSGPNRTADDVIIQIIDGDSAPRRLTIVSSDRQIRAAARRRRARSWASDEFLHKLAAALSRQPPGQIGQAKPAQLDEEQVEHWLRCFGFDSDEEQTIDDENEIWPPG